MENAVRALYIAAGVLIGIMVLSLGISLYSSLNGFVEDINQDLVNAQILEFNEKYLKYVNIDLTIHDLVTVANTAFENNRNSDYYVRVIIGSTEIQNEINEKSALLLENNLDKTYKCGSEDILIDSNTGRVCNITFHEIVEDED